jgi:DNA replication protein DnaC
MTAAKPIQQAAILQYAKQLHLPTLGDQFVSLAEEAIKEKQSHLSYLEALLGTEIEERDRKAVARRIQDAHFPGVKTLEEFDFESVRNRDRENASGNRAGGSRLPAAQASPVHHGCGDGN